MADDDGKYNLARRMVSSVALGGRTSALSTIPVEILIEWCEISPDDRYIFAAQTCDLFTKIGDDRSGSLSISEAALRILAHSRDRKTVLLLFIERFSPRSWSGHLSDILKERLPLLAGLNPNEDQELAAEIAKAQDVLKEVIASQIVREERENRERSESFE